MSEVLIPCPLASLPLPLIFPPHPQKETSLVLGVECPSGKTAAHVQAPATGQAAL